MSYQFSAAAQHAGQGKPAEHSAMACTLGNKPWCAALVVRGGGEEGLSWWADGHLLKKQNSFDDFASCAEYLHTAGYSTPAKLTIQVLPGSGRDVVCQQVHDRRLSRMSRHAGRLKRRPAHGRANDTGEGGPCLPQASCLLNAPLTQWCLCAAARPVRRGHLPSGRL